MAIDPFQNAMNQCGNENTQGCHPVAIGSGLHWSCRIIGNGGTVLRWRQSAVQDSSCRHCNDWEHQHQRRRAPMTPTPPPASRNRNTCITKRWEKIFETAIIIQGYPPEANSSINTIRPAPTPSPRTGNLFMDRTTKTGDSLLPWA